MRQKKQGMVYHFIGIGFLPAVVLAAKDEAPFFGLKISECHENSLLGKSSETIGNYAFPGVFMKLLCVRASLRKSLSV